MAALLEHRALLGKAPALLVITATGRESEYLHDNLDCFTEDAEIIAFPAWETLPHERLSPSAEIVGKRLFALRRMREWEETDPALRRPLIVIASVRAALQPVADNLTDFAPVVLTSGARGNDLSAIAVQLVELAYTRVDMVTRRGEFAVRGGILDVFPSVAPHPSRVEFFGDEVEQIRAFSVADQRSLPEPVASVSLPPSRELLLSPAVRQRAREMQHEFPSLSGLLAKIAEGIPVEGMESLAPALVDRLVPITHYLPAEAAVAVVSPERSDRGRRGADRPRVRRLPHPRPAARVRHPHRAGRTGLRACLVDLQFLPGRPHGCAGASRASRNR
jgi:transcription-repair coupling factor (superfamily II helicase)